jgi:hypothetical protein
MTQLLLILLLIPTAPAEWKEFTPTDGSFTIQFPGTPTEFKKSVKLSSGTAEVVLFEMALPGGDGRLAVGFTEFPEGSIKPGTEDKRLDNARDGAVASTKGTLVKQKILLLNNCPGRELLIKIDADTKAVVRLFAVKNRLYQMVVIGSGQRRALLEAAKFLASFKLVRERAVARRSQDC